MTEQRNTSPQTASVIVPVRDGWPGLGDLLEALANQDHPPAEVLVVNDGSTDSSLESTKAWAADRPQVNVRVLTQGKEGPATARNFGAREAISDIIVFIDSDCIPKPDWLEKMLLPFEENERVVGVQGAYKSSQTEWIARFSQIEIEERYHRMQQASTVDFIGTYAAAYRRDVFLAEGCFDTRFGMASGEDADFSFRLSDRGLSMVFQPEAVVYHKHPSTLAGYLRQKYWRAYWRNLIYRNHFSKVWKDSYTPFSLKVQTILGLALPISLLSLFLPPPWPWLPAAIIAGILATTLPFTLWVARKEPLLALATPLVLLLRTLVLSVGYAHGTLGGLWLE